MAAMIPRARAASVLNKTRLLGQNARHFSACAAKYQAAVVSSSNAAPFAQISKSADNWTNVNTGSEFSVTPKCGFLPRHDPLAVLPSYFEKLEEILDEMPIYKGDGTYGLLHSGRFGERVERELPMYDVDFVFDNRILGALYRDYTFLASAYLLEPCDIQFRLARNYGLARRILPANIAKPLQTVAARLNAQPFLEHSMSFTFYNYKRKDVSAPASIDNIEPIRRFSGCDAENSYIVGHVAAAQHTGPMIEASLELLGSAKSDSRDVFDQALQTYTKAMDNVNGILSRTLKNTGEYASFRTYLSGCKSQPMFSTGVIYEGTTGTQAGLPLAGAPEHQFFGVAQSSNPIASLNTHLFQLSNLSPQGTLPCSDGIDKLRPENYRAFFAHIVEHARNQSIQSYALQSPVSSAHYIAVLDQVLAYRYRQWANLRDSIHLQTMRSSSEFRSYLNVQTRHIRDIAELILRTRSNTDLEMLTPTQRATTDNVAHRAEIVRRSLSRVLEDAEPSQLATSMIAY
ncbi:hypothetical protein IW140_005458 [Coemansia sp. RSA 1813]|nr:hypothetical protein EV178_005432 [Coemansia sp. RSA 1646]KAJ1767497.1 hypothetical protein LPJ74_005324 [Coemansia sp. RSA 1843]KAJ2086764.1 hypothetical protein IW138_005442 [Coemansia sp. RSA 986]KAJ2211566.1 hypothetical protein EV179_005377 [Coemansia sp. RSA 487]KAJ2565118.1 hypothetical protein IW140_005458 [Coemansia sp. RSA 1813]